VLSAAKNSSVSYVWSRVAVLKFIVNVLPVWRDVTSVKVLYTLWTSACVVLVDGGIVLFCWAL